MWCVVGIGAGGFGRSTTIKLGHCKDKTAAVSAVSAKDLNCDCHDDIIVGLPGELAIFHSLGDGGCRGKRTGSFCQSPAWAYVILPCDTTMPQWRRCCLVDEKRFVDPRTSPLTKRPPVWIMCGRHVSPISVLPAAERWRADLHRLRLPQPCEYRMARVDQLSRQNMTASAVISRTRPRYLPALPCPSACCLRAWLVSGRARGPRDGRRAALRHGHRAAR